eukprot:COSAG01_NODE_12491_length_1729_cov_106.217178_4_plen_118_part_00
MLLLERAAKAGIATSRRQRAAGHSHRPLANLEARAGGDSQACGPKLTADDESSCRQAFRATDEDGDGYIDGGAELGALLQLLVAQPVCLLSPARCGGRCVVSFVAVLLTEIYLCGLC